MPHEEHSHDPNMTEEDKKAEAAIRDELRKLAEETHGDNPNAT